MRRPTAPFPLAPLLALLVLGCAAGEAQGDFLAGLEDLPLMPGLSEAPSGRTTFETPDGRIVERNAAGSVTRAAVLRFYAETLPQLGWQPAGEGQFTRGSERLRLDFAGGAEPLVVRFLITPG
ncbi:MAG: hypothetical protein JNK67_21335 [Alphaproteobacteria bacterium]|nr:hypothetical protein [Alphaproteobacteria bacterium]